MSAIETTSITTTEQMATTTATNNPTDQTGRWTNAKKKFEIYYSDTRSEMSNICNMLNITYRGWPYLPDTSGLSNKFYHVMLMLLYNRAYFNAPTSFGVLPTEIPSGISRQVVKMVIGESGFYLKKTTFETGVDFIWVDFGTNIFLVWGENHRCVYNALSAIKWRVNKYTKIVQMNENNLLLNSNNNINNNINKVSNDLNIANTTTFVSTPSLDVSDNSTCPLIDVGIKYMDGIERYSEIGDNFIYVAAQGNMKSVVINSTSECDLNPIWTKNETNALEIVESDDVPIVINEHEPDTETTGGDMSGLMSMLMTMLSTNPANKA